VLIFRKALIIVICSLVGNIAICATSLLSNVPEANTYTLVYEFNIPVSSLGWNSTPVTYTVDNSTNITADSFSRIAYYLETVSGTTTNWVYVSMDAFTTDPTKVGVPTTTSGEFYHYNLPAISNANIYTSLAGITSTTGVNTVLLEFWPSNYGTGNDYGVPGADGATYDFGDGGAGTSAGHACMQIHNYGAGQVLFAYNRWGGAGTSEFGMGNQVAGSGPDWTFNTDNISTYSSRTLLILVRGKIPIIDNASGATEIKSTSVLLNGSLISTGQTPTEVWAYWGTSDGGTNRLNWSNTNYFGTNSANCPVALTTNITGLSANTSYYYRFCASNAIGLAWATSSVTFTSLPNIPVLHNSSNATAITANSATLNGTLVSTGSAPCYVWVMSGTSDAGAGFTGWESTNYFGQMNEGNVSTNITGLSADEVYYYRFYGSNSFGDSWAATAGVFITGQVTVQATDSNAGETAMDPAVFTIYRPATTTNEPLQVYYRIAGTASNGVDYVSFTNPATIPAGAANTTITVTPVDDIIIENPESVDLTILSGKYRIGNPSNAVVTITNNDFKSSCRMKMKIIFNGYDPPAGSPTLTNFPALILLNESYDRFSYSDFYLPATGGDLRFMNSNETVHLNYEIEKWNTNGDSLIWVQVPELINNNTCIWAYWRSPVDTASPCTTNGSTWNENFAGVWHMNESGIPYYDSTTNHFNATGSTTPTQTSNGVIGNAQVFNGAGQSLQVPYKEALNTTQFTVSCWVKVNTWVPDIWQTPIMSRTGSGGTEAGYNFYAGSNRLWQAWVGTGPSIWSTIAAGPVVDGEWIYITENVSSDLIQKFYTNGVLVSTRSVPTFRTNTTSALTIGTGANYLNGYMDEIRVENVARSSNWVWACWMTQSSNSAFCTYCGGMDGVPRGSVIVLK